MTCRPADNEPPLDRAKEPRTSEQSEREAVLPIQAVRATFEAIDLDCLEDSELEGGQELDPELILSQILADPTLTQYLVRHQDQSRETLTGYFRCQMNVRQRRYILHVPFYPHFAEAPQVSATLFDDTAGRIRISEPQRFGVRIEIVLDHPAEAPLALLVEVSATGERTFPDFSEEG